MIQPTTCASFALGFGLALGLGLRLAHATPGLPPSANPASMPATSLPVADADAPAVAARTQPGQYTVGDRIALSVTAIAKSGVQVNLPIELALGPFELLDSHAQTTPTGDGHLAYTFTLSVAAFDTGDLTIPAIPLTYLTRTGDTRTIETEPVAVKIRSLLANENGPQLKESAPPVPVLQRKWTLVIVASVSLGVAIVALLSLFLAAAIRRRRQRARPTPPPRPPLEIARERLAALEAAAERSRDDYKPFYFALSEIVREYLGGRFGFDSLELTTTELVDELARRADGTPGSSTAHLPAIRLWLAETDLVKFAKYVPPEGEAAARLAEARALIEATVVSTPAGPTATSDSPAVASAGGASHG